MEEELRNLKKTVENSLIEQKMENNALEIEKQVDEKESKDWKTVIEKFVEAVRKLDELGAFKEGTLGLDENVKLGLELAGIKKTKPCKKVYEDDLSMKGLASHHQITGSQCITTPVKDYILSRNRDNEPSLRQVNKMLSFEDDCHKSTEVVDLCDDKTEERSEKESADAMDTLEERSNGENYEDEDVEATSTSLFGHKRKRVITSDSENDDEDADNIPISILKKMIPPNQEMQDVDHVVDTPTTEENTSGEVGIQLRVSSRLKKQREPKEISASSERNATKRLVGISTTGNAEDDETDEESEGESLDGFIIDDDIHETANENSDEILEEESDVEAICVDVMSTLRRNKKPKKQKWEYEADMLADFGKDPELCMKAVCVLYRFQTEDEKMSWSSHVSNGRGFSQSDAIRGTRIGKFLTDGDPQGDLKKSVEELKSFKFDDVEKCRALADKYSKTTLRDI